MKIEYDSYGRMKYNPSFHSKSGKVWSKEDLEYLKDWYHIIGPEEMSFALDRTIKSVMQKAGVLRRQGAMFRPAKQVWTKNIKKEFPKEPKLNHN
ncbi:hypothetical protein [Clostridium algidicarnis]|uniref:hypothetical protein n=1 Tax=Clostridium algidicarnis TaxID=37659 RepID=UPI003FD6EADF